MNEENQIGRVIGKGTKILGDAGIENNQAEARHLMLFILKDSLTNIYTRLTDELDEFTKMRYMKMIRKRATHYPLQYITGYTYFMEDEYLCRENVLIPRYDSEILVIHAAGISTDRPMKVLDMCTGSGCIGIAYGKEREEMGFQDDITLSDISDDALALAADNAEKLEADVRIVKSDLYEAFEDEMGNPIETFDMIISNPPYIRTKDINNLIKDVRDYEPRLALDGSMDGLAFYRRIISRAPEFLNQNGSIALEIGYDQYMDVADILKENGFINIHKEQDMSGLDRVISAQI